MEKDESASCRQDELDALVKEIDRLEVVAVQLVKDIKRLRDAVIDIQKLENKCVEHLLKSPLCSSSPSSSSHGGNNNAITLRQSVQSWNSSLSSLQAATNNLNSACKNEVQQPIKEYLKVLCNYHSALRKRQIALQEQAKAAGKWKKIKKESKFSVTTAKLNETRIHLSESEQLVSCLDVRLKRNLQTLLSSSRDLFDPILINLSISQMQGHRSNYSILNNLIHDTGHKADISENILEAQMKSLNEQLQSLSIVRGPIAPAE